MALLTVILLSSCLSCRNSNFVYNHLRFKAEGEVDLCIVPIMYDGNVYSWCCDITSPYYNLNIKIIPEEDFIDYLASHIINNQPIEVTEEFYHYILDCIVEEDSEMKLEYESYGITYIIEKYEPLLNDMARNSLPRFCYFVFLCWNNGYYVGTDDEDKIFYVYSPN